MDERIVTKSVSFSVSEKDGKEEREYTVSYSTGENNNKDKELWIIANGADLNFPLEDTPLLVQALQEFC